MSALELPQRPKPRLRGVSHELGFFVALAAGGWLVAAAAAGRPTIAAVVYGLSLAGLLGTSAFYHRPMWPPHIRVWLKRLDHSAIYVLIAGTYTPFAMLALEPAAGRRVVWLVWGGALAGMLVTLFWARKPRWLTSAIYVAMGWMCVWEWRAFARLGTTALVLLAAGGALYTVGAGIYAAKRPDPAPKVFGYHEIFHLLVIAAAVCHFVVVRGLVLKS